jgi:arylsulfatase
MKPTVPRPVNLRVDPFEQHMDAPAYALYAGEKLWTIMPAGYILKLHAETFKEFPPRQAPPNFNPGAILEHATKAAANSI